MSAANKDTVYIDVDDEITAIIDKVVTAKHKIVALVLPKRTTVLQSAVNMKLLKKAAKSANKNIVLITSESAISSIAAASGVHIAKTLSSKPAIPEQADKPEQQVEDVSLEDSQEVISNPVAEDSDEPIELDNTDGEVASEQPEIATNKKKIMKIPDFSSFRLRMGLGIGAIILAVILWVFGFVIMPRAKITINTDTSTASINTIATMRVGASEIDLEKGIIPVERVQTEKIDTVTVPATGEKNIGNKAVGKMNLTNCIKSDGVQIVPSGTRFSAGSVTFESTEQAILPEASFNASGVCKSKDNGDDKTVGVIAVEPGAQFNVGAQTYNSAISGIKASGSEMSGGSSQIVKVISAQDVKSATDQLSGKSKNTATVELSEQLKQKGKIAMPETLNEGTAKVDVTPAVGAEANEVKVTSTISYSMSGISEDDLNALLDNEVKKQNTDNPKNIKDNGRSTVKFKVVERPNDADIRITVETVATLGPDIDAEKIKEQIAGKKRGDIEKQLEAIEGVKSVSVEYSPFWITTTPKSAEKINIVFVEEDER